MKHDMNNQLMIPDDKIYIYPRVDMWPDYNWLGIDEELRSFIEDYVLKNFPKEEYSVSIHNECYCESLL